MRSALLRRRAARAFGIALAGFTLACQHFAPALLDAEAGADSLEARSLADPGLRAFVAQQTHATPLLWPPRHLDLDTATLAAFYFQPTLDVVRAQRDVAHGGVTTAAQRPNPSLFVAPEWSANPGTAASPWLAALHLDWPIETAGKRRHRIAHADALASAASRALLTEAWRIRHELRIAFAEAAVGSRRVALLRTRADAEARLVELLDQRVDTGAASRAEILPARLGWIATQAEVADAETRRASARARLAAAIGIPAAALDGIGVADRFASLDDPLDSIDVAGARRRALLERADVRAALDVYAASEAQLRLELAKQWPDLHLGNSYQFDEGQQKWGLALALDLPVMNRNEGPIAEAVAARREAAARFSALQAQVIADLDRSAAEYSGTREQLARTAAVVAEQRAAWERSRAARAQGASDLPTELAAEIAFRRGESIQLDAQLALEHARADFEAARQDTSLAADAIDASPRARHVAGTP